MRLLILVLSMGLAATAGADSYLCEGDKSKGACVNYEIQGRLQVKELPDDLSFSTFYKMRIPGTLKKKNLKGAELKEAELWSGLAMDSNFTWVNMRGFRGKDSNFSRSIFDHADLRGSKFYRARFVSSSFQKADLRETDLSFCDFSSADLRGANLKNSWVLGTTFRGARFDSKTKLPFSISTAHELGMISDEKLVEKNN
ncbi:hypothetical protein AZI86_16195 [Bdellovibrio bacteriovorus]|uniref:Pentapeptide repeat-containing protein n=1 Tax=Bdellovibrio bacteriovorus TaxID=959 RepID=A0A150WH06_BDEBC|nr:pentapeptide repeat-containing protein [Bdellovibrio bacteriovorus]KYG62377.1 hypothetical protein AZI86_16195 [Bdellovibrio bacteriovorus]